jgi:hypothetical protein
MNTIQLILDHTPNEIAELEQEITVMQERLRDHMSRKHLLEQLLGVAQQRQTERPVNLTLVQEDTPPLRATAGGR